MKKFIVEIAATGEKRAEFDCFIDALCACREESGSRVVRMDGKKKVPLTVPPTPSQKNPRPFTA